MIVYLIIRDLDSHDGPEVDVFEDFDDASEAAATLREQGIDFVEQEQVVMYNIEAKQLIAAMKEV